MRRFRVLLLLCLLLPLLLTACMNGDDDDGEGNGESESSGSPVTTSASVASTATTTDDADEDATGTSAPADATATDRGSATGTTSGDATATGTATGGAEAVTTPTVGTGTGTGTTPTAPQATSTPQDQDSLIADIEVQTAEIRELDYLQDVPVSIIPREELSDSLLADIEAEYPAEEAALDALELWLLRLVPERDFDLLQFQLDLLGEQVAGFYDPDEGEMVLVDESGEVGGSTILTLAHELTHALQDQHYDLAALQPDDLGADESTAVLALIEGDAESVSVEYINRLTPEQLAEVLADAMAVDTTVLDEAPAYLADSLYFPYEYGYGFVDYLLTTGGREAVDAAFADPPSSTEQIMHPEKYADAERDEPVVVELPDLLPNLGEDWTLAVEDTLGEFDLMVMLADNGASDAEDAAAGWGGTTYAVYQQGTAADAPALTVVGTAWDSDADAEEFRSALLGTLDASAADSSWTDDVGRVHRLVSASGNVYLLTGTDAASVDAAAAALAS